MPDAPCSEEAPSDVTEPRIGAGPWWLGLGATSLFAAVMTLIVYSEGLPAPFTAVPHFDKALHFGISGMLSFFLDGVLRRRMVRVAGIAVPLAAVLFLVPTAIEEFLQRYSIHRTSSLGDFAADVAGVACFLWLSRRIGR